jgi:membrane fusion protein (multidrug efflux system)
MKKSPVKLIVIVVLVLAVVGLLVVPQVLKGKGGAGPQGAPTGGPGGPKTSEPTVYSVKTEPLKAGILRDYLDLTGDVVTDTNVDVFADVGGKLAAVYVQVGDQVVKGKTVIAAVDPSKPGSNYALSQVYSPLTGTLTALNAQLGATISTSTSLGTVGVLTNLFVDVKVPETQVAALKTGLKADVQFEAFPGKNFAALVSRVDPVVDSTSRTKKIRLAFAGNPSGINLGMFAKVKLYLEAGAPQLLATQDAVISRLGKQFVFVAVENKAVKREVAVGQSVDGTVELLSGVKAGEELIVKGQELLDDGVQVKVVK